MSARRELTVYSLRLANNLEEPSHLKITVKRREWSKRNAHGCNFEAEAERSYILLRFEAENVLKMFLNYMVYTTCSLLRRGSAEAPLRKVSAGVKFRGRRRREPLPETTPNMAAIRGSHFVTRVVCVLMS